MAAINKLREDPGNKKLGFLYRGMRATRFVFCLQLGLRSLLGLYRFSDVAGVSSKADAFVFYRADNHKGVIYVCAVRATVASFFRLERGFADRQAAEFAVGQRSRVAPEQDHGRVQRHESALLDNERGCQIG